MPSDKSVLIVTPDTTWFSSICVSIPIGSASNVSITSAGIKLNASSVGAKTVNGPSDASVSSNPAATIAVSSVLCASELSIMSNTVLVSSLGINIASMTCTTPLSAIISATITFAFPIITIPSVIDTDTSPPCSVVTIMPSDKSVLNAVPDTTWFNSICVNCPVGSASNVSRTSSGIKPNASSVGANTVKGPSDASVSSKPAATIAASSVLCISEFSIIPNTVCEKALKENKHKRVASSV